MHCIYCNREHRSLLDGGDGCDPFAEPDLSALPLAILERVKARKPRAA